VAAQGPYSAGSPTSGMALGHPEAPPRRMQDHDLESVDVEIHIAQARICDAEVELTSAREYLAALHGRRDELVSDPPPTA
jgi:hypothetical protein